ncbi:RecX family transcriptional regulator [Chitinophaga parva]|uniref:Regulatory protein RecX n=1 Tax=Chitinophaga parva TaxID=2169414 RepID=A0A2T7BKH3_9BACT|nr:regulatory protein RecX [Chitinophaga parva]PUZ28176.1 RecX family transcriptional regulator [Chitinophaga parva]
MRSAILQLRSFCAYQERCHSEVREKALELGMRGEEVEQAMAELISENFLNEERYAGAFAGGKFRMQQWGRRKITAELQQKQVSAYCIKRGLAEIDEADYQATLEKLARKKWDSLGKDSLPKRRQKTWAYLAQKGYEPALITPVLEKLGGREDD